jgi:hypothetical protein
MGVNMVLNGAWLIDIGCSNTEADKEYNFKSHFGYDEHHTKWRVKTFSVNIDLQKDETKAVNCPYCGAQIDIITLPQRGYSSEELKREHKKMMIFKILGNFGCLPLLFIPPIVIIYYIIIGIYSAQSILLLLILLAIAIKFAPSLIKELHQEKNKKEKLGDECLKHPYQLVIRAPYGQVHYLCPAHFSTPHYGPMNFKTLPVRGKI